MVEMNAKGDSNMDVKGKKDGREDAHSEVASELFSAAARGVGLSRKDALKVLELVGRNPFSRLDRRTKRRSTVERDYHLRRGGIGRGDRGVVAEGPGVVGALGVAEAVVGVAGSGVGDRGAVDNERVGRHGRKKSKDRNENKERWWDGPS